MTWAWIQEYGAVSQWHVLWYAACNLVCAHACMACLGLHAAVQGSGHTWDSPFTNAGVDLEPRGPNGPPAHGSMHGVRRARCSASSHNGTVPVLMQPTHPSGQASGHEHILAPIASTGKADEVQGERQLPMDGCHGSSAGAGSTGTNAATSKAEPFKHQVGMWTWLAMLLISS